MKKNRKNQMEIALRQVEQRLEDAARSEDDPHGSRLIVCLTPAELERFLDAFDEREDLATSPVLPRAYEWVVVPGPETSQ